ncbi:MAG: hypothetical protein AAFO95_03115 [Cyanobacteria bacterium J06600_6]
MSNDLIWQSNSSDPSNVDSLQAIADWWSELDGKEVVWQQRLIATSDTVTDLDWQLQKFDEKFILTAPQVRGITLYWSKRSIDERNITPSKLLLYPSKQKLYIFPQSQSQVVISVSLPVTTYQKLNLLNPQIAATIKDNRGIILLRDATEKLEVTVTLNSSQVSQLLNQLKTIDNQ